MRTEEEIRLRIEATEKELNNLEGLSEQTRRDYKMIFEEIVKELEWVLETDEVRT